MVVTSCHISCDLCELRSRMKHKGRGGGVGYKPPISALYGVLRMSCSWPPDRAPPICLLYPLDGELHPATARHSTVSTGQFVTEASPQQPSSLQSSFINRATMTAGHVVVHSMLHPLPFIRHQEKPQISSPPYHLCMPTLASISA